MKAAREKKVPNIQGKTDQVCSRPIHRNLTGQNGMAGYIQCAESEKYVAKNSLSSKAVIQNRRRDKKFPRQKLKEFVTTKPALQEILRVALRGEKMKKNETKQDNK